MFFLPLTLPAQDYLLQDSLNIKDVKQLNFDLEGNLYVLSGNSIIKYSSENEKIGQFTSSSAIHYFSVPTKWKIYLFADQEVQILNNQLAPLGEKITTAGKPYAADSDNAIWQMNNYSSNLVKVDLNTDQELLSFRVFGDPEQVLSSNNKIYVRTKEKSVLVFSNIGRLLEEFQDINSQIIKAMDQVYIIKKEKLVNLQSNKAFELPQSAQHVALNKNQLALAYDDIILIYRLEK